MASEHIGRKLRRLRRARDLTLSAVALEAGCSESMISKIETGRVMPSLTIMRGLTAALGVNVTAMFEDGDPQSIVSKRGSRPRLSHDTLRVGDGIILESLIAQSNETSLQANIHIVLPGGASDGTIAHLGEEVGYVLEGELELTVGSESFLLAPGDSFHFNSNLSHGYRNMGDAVARILWVNTPPTF
ncbi:helix-turn-helix domain-containing protein [Roseovarius amoyensis]|uniref:helix-turn-helix domain-containing protein n=1 Tax=Roseovarius amoyensis TaxID=2211448 RepID=UPI000DBEA99C|nr:XRE family transcriptional regulator [Roseovarius amoyensis]